MYQTSMSDASMMSSMSGSSLQSGSANRVSADALIARYGTDNVNQAVANFAAEYVGVSMNALMSRMPMRQFQQDMAGQAMESVFAKSVAQVPDGAAAGVAQLAASSGGSSISPQLTQLFHTLDQSASDTLYYHSRTGNGNWLAVLARALGKVAGEHLEKMVELGEKMAELDSTEEASEFAATQADFQAEAQIFRMFQESIATMIKSIGEAMSTVARKQ